MHGIEPRLRPGLVGDLALLVHVASKVLKGRLVPQSLFVFTVEFADVPGLGSLEIVHVRGTTLVLCLHRVLVRTGDKDIVKALHPRPGKSSNVVYLLVTVVVHYYHCNDL